MVSLENEFPVLGRCTYLNTAASGLLSKSLIDWRARHDQAFLEEGSMMKSRAIEDIPGVRQSVARFFKTRPDNVALVPNFSLGLNLLLEGMDKRKKVLLLENDYPSVNWPFVQRGFPVRYIKVDEYLEDSIYDALRQGDFSILSLSLVQWSNGICIDLDFLRTLKIEFPSLLIIADGTQFLGTMEFDFETSGIDVLGASGYKWLLAGYGNGFFLLKEGLEQHLSLKSIGFNSVDGDFSKKGAISLAKHLEPGHLDTLTFGSLQFALDFLEKIGLDKIKAKNRQLLHRAIGNLEDLGLLPEYMIKRKHHGNILNIRGDEKVFQYLLSQNIICSQRGNGIRLSFHFYNVPSAPRTDFSLLAQRAY
ncbi:MAG: aminotransferase class V-fold PLP-dependent enzyme [Bacteroidota bacterium]